MYLYTVNNVTGGFYMLNVFDMLERKNMLFDTSHIYQYGTDIPLQNVLHLLHKFFHEQLFVLVFSFLIEDHGYLVDGSQSIVSVQNLLY